MNKEDILARLRDNEADLKARGVTHAAVFGSRARGNAGPDSDIDIMVEIAPEAVHDVYEYVGLKSYIASLFEGPVDVVNREALKPYVRPAATADAVYAFQTNASEEARWLHHIRHNIYLARRFVGGIAYEEFRDNDRVFYALTRALEIISEASRRLPQDMKDRHPHIPWVEMAAAGNVYRHDYEDVEQHFVWGTVHNRFPAMLVMVETEMQHLDKQS